MASNNTELVPTTNKRTKSKDTTAVTARPHPFFNKCAETEYVLAVTNYLSLAEKTLTEERGNQTQTERASQVNEKERSKQLTFMKEKRTIIIRNALFIENPV